MLLQKVWACDLIYLAVPNAGLLSCFISLGSLEAYGLALTCCFFKIRFIELPLMHHKLYLPKVLFWSWFSIFPVIAPCSKFLEFPSHRHTLDKLYSMSPALQPAPPGPVFSIFSLISYAFGLLSKRLLLVSRSHELTSFSL